MKDLKITVKTLYGFEDILQEELKELGYDKTEKLNRAVQVKGGWEDVYRLNYRCRLAISVLVEVASFYIQKEKDLYDEAKKIDWTSFFEMEKTFAVKGAVFSNLFTHTQYPFLLVKDAIADVFRDKFDARPNVNIKAPQVMFDVYIKEKSVTVSLNTSGIPLFQRGYRQEVGDAPMNEVLAAGLLRLSNWDKKSPLIDPMCGSGTLAIEAALLAADIPSMVERQHYAFKNFKSFDAEAWEKVQSEVNRRPVDLGFKIFASDIDAGMLQKAKRNSRMAPIGNMISFTVKDVFELEPPSEKGLLICNPPYGERMGEDEDIAELYQKLGDAFKNSFVGYDCWVISSNIDAIKSVGLKASKKIKVFNGNLECSFREFKVFEGSKKIKKPSEKEDKDEQSVQSKKIEPVKGEQIKKDRLVERKQEHPIEKRERPVEKKIEPVPYRKAASKYKPVNQEEANELDDKKPEAKEKEPEEKVQPKQKEDSAEEKMSSDEENLSLKEKIAKMKKYRSRD
ncbi:MAG: RNA methyltransferase [Fluviicola sp.]|nr:MAG: RNA methyltransferase [Fluviicola sp.]